MHIHWERHADRRVERIQWNAFQKILNEPLFVRSLPLGNTLGCHFSYMRPFLNQIHTWHYNRKCIGAITTRMSHNIDTYVATGVKNHRNTRRIACKKTGADRSNETDLSFVQAQNKTQGNLYGWGVPMALKCSSDLKQSFSFCVSNEHVLLLMTWWVRWGRWKM